MKQTYNRTLTACYTGYVVQAIVNNFVPLLFLTFQNTYHISMRSITLLITVNFLIQLMVDCLSAGFIDRRLPDIPARDHAVPFRRASLVRRDLCAGRRAAGRSCQSSGRWFLFTISLYSARLLSAPSLPRMKKAFRWALYLSNRLSGSLWSS